MDKVQLKTADEQVEEQQGQQIPVETDKGTKDESAGPSASDNETEYGPIRADWSEPSTRCLISLYKSNSKHVGKRKKFTTYKELWEHISKEMKRENFHFTPNQVKQKWDALIRSFKEGVKCYKTGQKRKILYHRELLEIMKKRRIMPEQLMEEYKEWDLADQHTEEKAQASDWSLIKFTEFLQAQHRECMKATEKWRKEKMAFKLKCEENRHRERMLLIDGLISRFAKDDA